jgi:hypothetical protein
LAAGAPKPKPPQDSFGSLPGVPCAFSTLIGNYCQTIVRERLCFLEVRPRICSPLGAAPQGAFSGKYLPIRSHSEALDSQRRMFVYAFMTSVCAQRSTVKSPETLSKGALAFFVILFAAAVNSARVGKFLDRSDRFNSQNHM